MGFWSDNRHRGRRAPLRQKYHWAHPMSAPRVLLAWLRVILCLFLFVSTGYLLFKYVSFGMRVNEFQGVGQLVWEGFKNVPWALYAQAGACLYLFIVLVVFRLIACCFRRPHESAKQLKSQNIMDVVKYTLNTVIFIGVGVVTAIRIFPGTAFKVCDPDVPGLPGTPWEDQSVVDDFMGDFMAEDADLGGRIGAITDLFTNEKLVCPIYKTDMWVCWVLALTFLVELALLLKMWSVARKRMAAEAAAAAAPKLDPEAGLPATHVPLMAEQKSAEPIVTPGWVQEENHYQYQGAQQQYYGNPTYGNPTYGNPTYGNPTYGNTAYDPYGRR